MKVRDFTIKMIIIAVLLVGVSVPSFSSAAAKCPEPASNWNVVGNVCVPSSTRTGLSEIPIYSEKANQKSVLLNVILWLTGFLAALTVLVIVIAGIMYITAGGDEDRANAAKKTLTYAIIGLVIALLAWVIVKVISTTLGAG